MFSIRPRPCALLECGRCLSRAQLLCQGRARTSIVKRNANIYAWLGKKKRKDIKIKCNGSPPATHHDPPKTNIHSLENNKFSPERFFNPWKTLAEICPSEDMLSDKVESTTRTFGIVSALMGSLAAALLTLNPYDGYDANRLPIVSSGDALHEYGPSSQKQNTSTDNDDIHNHATTNNGDTCNKNVSYGNQPPPFSPLPLKRTKTTNNFIEHVTFTHHTSGTSLLVSWGIPESKLDDFYTACCAGSFYTGVGTTVLSSIINAWLAATPPGGVRTFVKMHSWFIVAMPALLGISTGLAGSALFIGLDRAHGTPVCLYGFSP